MKSGLLLIGAALMAAAVMPSANAQEEKAKFKFTPTGRILFDGALFAPHHDGFTDGVAIPDIRPGGKATYGNWLAKIDV